MLRFPVSCGSRPVRLSLMSLLAVLPVGAHAATGLQIAGIPLDFFLFAATLAGVALFHHHTLQVAVGGLAVLVGYKLLFTGFATGTGLAGLVAHLQHESVTLLNLFCLLMGFALLARHFEKSHLPLVLPRILPAGWQGGFWLLVLVFCISAFLDNIAAALIGGAMAHQIFGGRVHVGYLAAIVAASNAGGSGSVLGDTTTTMMWIAGVSPLDVLHAYVAAATALVFSGIIAARQQQAHAPMIHGVHEHTRIDWVRLGIVLLMLLSAVAANLFANVAYPELADVFPWIGVAVWTAIVVSIPLRRPDWELLPDSFRGSVFLLSLVTAASLMPVEALPPASPGVAFVLGFVSSVFDNIPLTSLAIKQGGYDWGVLAYAVGYGGSMLWFGSSAGVALSSQFPEARSARAWLRHGWHVAAAYVVGFAVLMLVLGWHPGR